MAVAVGTGCSTDDRTNSDGMVRTGSESAEVDSNGRLRANPVPLTLRDVAKHPERSAAGTVLRLLFWAQWGNLPAVVDSYDRRVVYTLGVSSVTGPYSWIRQQLVASEIHLAGTKRTGSTLVVRLRLLSKNLGPQRESFVLRPSGGEPRVVYDTLLDRAINGWTAYRLSPDATASDPPPARVLRRAEEASQHYRDIYPSIEINLGSAPAPAPSG